MSERGWCPGRAAPIWEKRERLMTKFLDRDHPIFAKMWVRVATTALPLVWAAIEFWFNSPGWGLMFLAAGLWALWELFLRR